jgi:class 3 adenylate cyclase/tetratricopeptide (TPR) repeat protein
VDAPSDRTAVAERKLVTALFCDLVGSTSLGERLDPEAMGRVQAAYFDRLRSVVESHGGTIEKFIGDAVVAIFGVPAAHEDDAERAVRCALAVGPAMAGLNDTLRARFGVELEVRIGIDTGEAIVTGRTADAIATGDVLNTAARLEAAAGPGEILVGRDTMVLARQAIEFEGPRSFAAKGKAEPVEAWEPTGLAADGARPRVPLVGRVGELEVLGAALERAIREDAAQVVLVLGEPGIGKSRLVEEFASRTRGRAAVLRGACRSYGEDTAWRPLADVIRAHAGIAESDPPETAGQKLRDRLEASHPAEEAKLLQGQLAPLLGAGRSGVTSGGEVLWAVRRFLEVVAREQPCVVVLDDLHWGGETLLETLEELVETIGPAPLVLLFVGRPELRERMAGALPADRTTTLALGGLSKEEAAQLVTNLQDVLGQSTAAGTAALQRRTAVVGQAAGNPLFLEEMARAEPGQGGVDDIPSSIHALIAARLDLLPPEAKLVAQIAAVVGDVFWTGAVAAALANDERTDSSPALRTLRTRGLIEEQAPSAFLGDRQFAFHHALIREVAYGSLPKHRRAEVHPCVAEWLGGFAQERPELWGAAAHHWERALLLAREVEPLETPDPAVVEAAASSLLAAGRWAQSNAALPEAIELLRRASAVSRGSRFEPLCSARLALVLAMAGEGSEARAIAEGIPPDADAEASANAALALATVEKNAGSPEGIRAHAPAAIELARRAGVLDVEVQALDALAWAAFWVAPEYADLADAQRTWEEASELARADGDLTQAARAKGFAALAAVFRLDMSAADRGVEEATALAEAAGSIRALVPMHSAATRARELRGQLEESLEHGRQWFELASQAGERLDAVAASAFGLAPPLRLLGRLDEAWTATENGLGIVREMKESVYESAVRWERVRLLLLWGRTDEADEELDRIAPLSDLSDEGHYRLWGTLAAPVRAAQGRDDEAEELWRRAIGPGEHDWVVAESLIDFAGFLLDRGRLEDARKVVTQAGEIVKGTGALLLEGQVGELEARLKGR